MYTRGAKGCAAAEGAQRREEQGAEEESVAQAANIGKVGEQKRLCAETQTAIIRIIILF